MLRFRQLPYELSLKIFLFVGWRHHNALKKDIQHFCTCLSILTGLYDHNKDQLRQYLKSECIIKTIAKFSHFHRILYIYNSPKNYFISYVQEYPSFILYDIKQLHSI